MTQVDAPRTRLNATARREQLLEATAALVAERGFHGVSIEAVAGRAGITRPIVYHHFGDLPGLLRAFVEQQERRALEQLAAALPADAAGRDPRDLLLGAFAAYLDVVRADPLTWRNVLMPAEGAPAILRERVAAGRAAVLAQLAELVRSAAVPGGGSPDPELSAHALSALADEAARLLLDDPGRYPAARILAHARWLIDRLGS